uniref:Poly(A) polymerase n=1 Tax=Knipowitschia caucasica TaxID=637954 RepID=A0AAV2MD62_KNICA
MSRFLKTSEDSSKRFGLSRPIREEFPSVEKLHQTTRLTESLKTANVFSSRAELEHREKIVGNLSSLFKQWLQEMCTEMNVPQLVREQVGGKVLSYGSFAMGQNMKDADIDLLCVGPRFIPRESFFSSFVEKLRGQQHVQVKHVLENAFVPVIKLIVESVEVDMVYAKINGRRVSDSLDLMDSTILQEMDVISVRSLQGYRDTQEIMSLVPNAYTFRLALAAIKQWAKRRNIYSNMLGFLCGVSCAIMLARICQMCPYATAAVTVATFFRVYSSWNWASPVMLRVPEEQNCNLPSWNPSMTRQEQMAIITPSYPQQNSSYNVNPSTIKIMKEEIRRGHAIMEHGLQNRSLWKQLFEPSDFFKEYSNYVVLRVSAPTQAKLEDWTSYLQSRVRHLVEALGRNPNISAICPSPQSFTERDGLSTSLLLGIKIHSSAVNRLDLRSNARRFIQRVYTDAKSSTEGIHIDANFSDRSRLKELIPAMRHRQ